MNLLEEYINLVEINKQKISILYKQFEIILSNNNIKYLGDYDDDVADFEIAENGYLNISKDEIYYVESLGVNNDDLFQIESVKDIFKYLHMQLSNDILERFIFELA